MYRRYDWDTELFRRELAHIVNIDSGTHTPEGITAVGKYLAEKFEAEGFNVKEYDGYRRLELTSPSCRTRTEADEIHRTDIETPEAKEYDLLLAGHMDTVFPEGTAAKRPYTEKNGLAYGPGTADMKGGLIMVLHLVRRLIKDQPQLKICCAFNSDEEIGSPGSKDWLTELALRSRYAFVFEPGRNGNAFARSRKGCMNLELTIHGTASHAGSAPEKGANAVIELAHWITEFSSLQNLEKGTSVSPGLISGGTAANVIPDKACASFDIRFTDAAEVPRIKAAAEYLAGNPVVFGTSAEYRFIDNAPPMTPQAETLKLIDKMNRCADKLGIDIGWIDSGGFSNANNIAVTGTPVICGCGPCGEHLHSDREFLELSSIEKRLNLMYSVLSEINDI